MTNPANTLVAQFTMATIMASLKIIDLKEKRDIKKESSDITPEDEQEFVKTYSYARISKTHVNFIKLWRRKISLKGNSLIIFQ